MEEKNQTLNKKNGYSRVFLLLLQGVLIGIGAILPGLSGGALCVIFGLYQPVIAFLSNPIANMKRYWRLLIPAGIGVAIGFLGFAGAVNAVMEKNSQAAVCVFAGLIIGMIPALLKDARGRGVSKFSLPIMLCSFVLFLSLFLYLEYGVSMTVVPNVWWYGVCGVAWGLSIIVPGLSSSSVLIFFGLYQPMLAGLSSFNMGVIIPLGIGAAIIVFTVSKAVNKLFAFHYSAASHFIIGVVMATTVPIIPYKFKDTGEFVLDMVCIVAGIFAAMGLNRLCSKWAEDKNAEDTNCED